MFVELKTPLKRTIIAFLLSSAALVVAQPVRADQSLEELEARLEKAKKRNLQLKAEMLERENMTIETEALEKENARMEALKKTGKQAQGAQKSEAAENNKAVATRPAPHLQRHVASRSIVERTNGTPDPKQIINDALASMPANDPRRQFTAADMRISVHKEPPVIVSYWDGIYVGINAGYGYNDAIATSSQIVSPGQSSIESNGSAQSGSANTVGLAIGSLSVSGPVVGGQVGYNYIFHNKFLIGAEIDMDYADIRSSGGYGSSSLQVSSNTSGTSGGSFIFGSNSYSRIGLDWLGTARLRVGYAAGNFLPYLTGGVAYGQLTATGSSGFGYGSSNYSLGNQSNFGTLSSNATNEKSILQFGWALGAGAEYMIADGFSLKAEYMYTSIGGIEAPVYANNLFSNSYSSGSNGAAQLGYGQAVVGQFGVHQFRGGLNYHIRWEPSSTVVAKY